MPDLLASLDPTFPDWKIECLPLRHARGRVAGRRALVRSDNGRTLGIVRKGFRPVDHRHALKLADSLGFPFQGVRFLEGSRRYVLVFGTEATQVAGEDTSLHLCLLVDNRCRPHGCVTAHLLYRRLVCLNVFDSLAHDRGLAYAMNPQQPDAGESLSRWIKANLEATLARAEHLRNTEVSDRQMRQFALFAGPQSAALQQLWRETADLEEFRFTGWGAYQAIAAYLTHHDPHAVDLLLTEGHWMLPPASSLLQKPSGTVRPRAGTPRPPTRRGPEKTSRGKYYSVKK